MNEHEERLIFKINDVDSVDLSEYISAIDNFADVIREAALVAGYGDTRVRIKPIQKGSVRTELVVRVVELLSSPPASAASNLVTIVSGLYNLIKFTKGKVNKFKKNGDGETVEYSNDDGNSVTVPVIVHQVVQNPIARDSIVNSVKESLGKMDGVYSIAVGDANDQDNLEVVMMADRSSFDKYENAALDEEYDEATNSLHGIYLKPVRGSYSGENIRYTFANGSEKYYPTTIKDKDFRQKLRQGDIKLFSGDLIKVDLTVTQKTVKATKRITTSYSIDKVHEYIPRNQPLQTTFLDG